MQLQTTENPYGAIGEQLAAGLDAIIAQNPKTIDELVNATTAYIEFLYYPNATKLVCIELSSIGYHSINSYRNNLVLSGLACYNANQKPFIELLIGPTMTVMFHPDTY